MGPGGEASAVAPYVWLVVLAVVAYRLIRRLKPRPLRIGRMWITPALILSLVALSFAVQPPPRLAVVLAGLVALAAGAGLGWWRGATTRIEIDPKTRELTSQASAFGMLLILGVIALRIGLRQLAGENALAWGVTPLEIADVSLLFAAGLVCVQRLEMWLRARRLLAETPGF